MGDVGGRVRLLSDYKRFHYVPTIAHEEVVQFVRARRLHLLASAVAARIKIWTADHALSGSRTTSASLTSRARNTDFPALLRHPPR
jgi:hypothetical protein